MLRRILVSLAVVTLVLGFAPSSANGQKMYWTDLGDPAGTGTIRRANLDGSNIEVLLTGLEWPYGIALDVTVNKMYWVDGSEDAIYRANLDGSNVEDILTGLVCPDGIALDLSAGKLYWTESCTSMIGRANLDGSNIEHLITTDWPFDIALHVDAGKMYWPLNSAHQIKRANMDGTNIEVLVSVSGHPGFIALDLQRAKMYWSAIGPPKIQRANLDGSGVEDLVTGTEGLEFPEGIAVDPNGGKMYWIDANTHKIQRADLDGSNIEDLISDEPPYPLLGVMWAIALDLRSCEVSPTSLNFGTVMVGSYLDRTFTITNTSAEVLVGSVSESCNHYSIVSGGGAYELSTDESVVVTVRFEPGSGAEHNCSIEAGNGVCSDVSCTGQGEEEPACEVSPASLNFGTVTMGSYMDKTFTITNTGGGTLDGNVSEACDHYSIVSGGGAYTLDASEWVEVTVRFEPESLGSHNCVIETGNGLCSDVSCTGQGDEEPPCDVSPTSLNFGTLMVGSYMDKTFTITNTAAEVLLGTVSESCNHYRIVSGGGGYELSTDASVAVTVRFEPGSVGQHGCTIETGNALCVDVACSGQGWQGGEGIPTVSEWGLLAIALLVLTAGTLAIRRQKAALLKSRR